MSQKTTFFIVTAVKTSNLTYVFLLLLSQELGVEGIPTYLGIRYENAAWSDEKNKLAQQISTPDTHE
jgi:hypothetical protein